MNQNILAGLVGKLILNTNMPNTRKETTKLSEGSEIKLGSIYYELSDSSNTKKIWYLIREELMSLVDYGINQMSEKEKKQLYKDHGFDNFRED
jgi:hypothetical protein